MSLQQLDRYQQFVGSLFKEHTELSPQEARRLDWALGLNEEAGEVASVVKHATFHGEPLDRAKLVKELGDVLWYVTALAETEKISLSEILDTNVDKLTHRHGASYSHETSANRHEIEDEFDKMRREAE